MSAAAAARSPAIQRQRCGGWAKGGRREHRTGTEWLQGVNKHTSAFQLWPLRSPLPPLISPPSAPRSQLRRGCWGLSTSMPSRRGSEPAGAPDRGIGRQSPHPMNATAAITSRALQDQQAGSTLGRRYHLRRPRSSHHCRAAFGNPKLTQAKESSQMKQLFIALSRMQTLGMVEHTRIGSRTFAGPD